MPTELWRTQWLLWKTLEVLDVIVHDQAVSTLRGRTLAEVTRDAFDEALTVCQQNQSQAAALLGISRRTMHLYVQAGRKVRRWQAPDP